VVAFGSECLLVLLSRQSGRGTITSHRRKSFLKACERRRPTKLVGIWKTSDEKVRINDGEGVRGVAVDRTGNKYFKSFIFS